MEKISWTDRVRNEVLHTVNDVRFVLPTINKRERLTGLVIFPVETAF
jgi:hypothetical protein